jgi:hypothetical protein
MLGAMSIDSFLRFAASYDASFPAAIEGATEDEIRELEALVGLPLPSDYRHYLSAMGRADGGIDLACDGTTTIADLIGYYRERVVGAPYPPPPGCVVIRIGDLGCLCMEASGAHRVVWAVDHGIDRIFGASLTHVLHRQAFIKYELAQKPASAFYIDGAVRDLVLPAAAVLRDAGFETLWFSDSEALCAVQGTTSVVVERSYGTKGLVKIAGAHRADVERMGVRLQTALGLTLWRWWRDTPGP